MSWLHRMKSVVEHIEENLNGEVPIEDRSSSRKGRARRQRVRSPPDIYSERTGPV